MGGSAERKEQSHREILRAAGRLVRRRGVRSLSVAEVMKSAGLTVGGFYAHFSSKESLMGEALLEGFRSLRERLFAGLSALSVPERRRQLLRRYLSRSHRDQPEDGCPLPAVVSEAAHEGDAVRAALARGVGSLADEIAALFPEQNPVAARREALALVSLMYGGLSLARALSGTPLSDEILLACRELGARRDPDD